MKRRKMIEMPRNIRLLMLQPSDVLCVTNMGQDYDIEQLEKFADDLKAMTKASQVVVFPEDVDFAVLRKEVSDDDGSNVDGG